MIRPAYYSQNDARWKSKPYTSIGDKSQTIGSSGCGPSCAAMVIQTLRKIGITPVETCDWSVKHGYRTASQGTEWGYFVPQFAEYGISARMTYSFEDTKKALSAGKMVIGRAKKGLWTSGGHYILGWGLEQGNVYINDPNSTTPSKCCALVSHWDAEVTPFWIVEEDIKGMTYQEWCEYLKKYREELAKEPADAWAKEACSWAINNGYIVGDGEGHYNWKSPTTRQELMAILKRIF